MLEARVGAQSSAGPFAFLDLCGMAVGRLAQLVEQLTLNQRVAGSNPASPTKLSYIQTGAVTATGSMRAAN